MLTGNSYHLIVTAINVYIAEVEILKSNPIGLRLKKSVIILVVCQYAHTILLQTL